MRLLNYLRLRRLQWLEKGVDIAPTRNMVFLFAKACGQLSCFRVERS